jgi:hypothetical protein
MCPPYLRPIKWGVSEILSRFSLIFRIVFSIILNEMNTEYRIKETDGFIIDHLLLTIDYFFRVNLRLSAV